MNKNILLTAAIAFVGLSLTGCEDKTDPKVQIPDQNEKFLNTPVLANQTFVLDQTEGVEFTCSQPNYGGVATIPTYAVQVSLSKEFNSVPSEWLYTGDDATPQDYIQLPSTYTNTTFTVPAKEIADAVNGCRGYNNMDQLKAETGYRDYEGPIYVRLMAYFPNASEDTQDLYRVYSAPVTLASVVGYPTVRQPGYIYLVGAPEGWAGPEEANAEHYKPWMLYEGDDQIGSQIYTATFDIPAGQFQFRFYKALSGWDGGDSMGSQADDNPVDIAFKEEEINNKPTMVYNGPISVPGKGSWQVPGWAGGRVTMVVNVKNKTVQFIIVND